MTSRIYNYNRSLDDEDEITDYWNTKLSDIDKKLGKHNEKIVSRYCSELYNNYRLRKIFRRASRDGLYVSGLTKLDGNCLFNSLEKSNFFSNVDGKTIRKCTVMLFHLFGDMLITDLTLKETFTMTNEIRHVYCETNEKLYIYTYYTMCCDMNEETSWSRLPVQLILHVLSLFFRINFRIYHDNGTILQIYNDNGVVNAVYDKPLFCEDRDFVINIGLMGEYHYVPLDWKTIGDGPEKYCLQYDTYTNKYNKLAEKLSDMLGLYEGYDNEKLDNSNDSNDSNDNDNNDNNDNDNNDNDNNDNNNMNFNNFVHY